MGHGLVAARRFILAATCLLLLGPGCQSVPRTPEEKLRRSVERYQQAISLRDRGNPDQAIGRFRESLSLNPSMLQCRRDLGLVLFYKGNSYETDARDEELKGEAINNTGDVQAAQRQFTRSMEIRAKGRPFLAEARDLLSQVNQTDPGDPEVLRAIGSIYLFQDDYASARSYFEAGRGSPRSSQSWRDKFQAMVATCDRALSER